jgi:hypothetical protein
MEYLIQSQEILIQRVKKLAPEEIAQGIKEFEPVVCTQVFLSELKRVIPSPEQVNPVAMTLVCEVVLKFICVYRLAN